MSYPRPQLGGIFLALLLAPLVSGCSEPPGAGASSGGPLPDTKQAPPAVQWVDATVPAGTSIHLVLADKVGSGTSQRGVLFRSTLKEPVKVEGVEVLPGGSVFQGIVSQVTAAGQGQKGGSMVLLIKTVYTPAGAGATVAAELTKIGDGSTRANGPSLSTRAVAGASKTGVVVLEGNHGKDVLLDVGTPLTIALSEPLVIKVKK